MSETESFIEEVSEEVRRDKLYAAMRRYGWIVAALVILLVGGASYNEYRKSVAASQAQDLGDAVLAAMNAEDPQTRITSLAEVQSDNEGMVVVQLLRAAELSQADRTDEAVALYDIVAQNAEVEPLYRDLAQLKKLALQAETADLETRRAGYVALAAPGSAYRLLAEEQLALLDIEEGQTDPAIERLQQILADGEVTGGLRRRASQLIVALGGSLDPS
ncbi:hypothetical protein [Algirhabdus cladophorae]|uniref:hypothetical protein n=1 Tax=Algirhabdus cladophorae TaxID=3377108 RepID=UPI003B8484DB